MRISDVLKGKGLIDCYVLFSLFSLINRYFPIYEHGVTKAFIRLVNKGATIIDIGANIGIYTYLASKIVGKRGKVYAFEPSPLSYKKLEKNTCLLSNVFCFPFAISNKSEKRFFNTHRFCFVKEESKDDICVSSVSLEDFCGDKINNIDVIKIDVEGAEVDVIRGMSSLLSIGHVKLIVEVHPELITLLGDDISSLTEELNSFGYKTFLIKGNEVVRLPELLKTHNWYIFSKEDVDVVW